MATIFKLIIEDDEGKTTVYPLADGDLTIGRKDGNTIRLMERNVSRRHARLERTNGAVYIQDLDSYNGVKINGERISGKYEVKEGDLVEIGDYHLALQKSVTRSEAPEPVIAGKSAWPQAGTVPDFTLPNELIGDERNPRDTIIDQPAPTAVSAKIIAKTVDERPKPLPAAPQGDVQGRLPPFPSSSGPVSDLRSAPDSSLPTLPPHASPKDDRSPERGDGPPPLKSDLAPGPDSLSSMPRLICVSTTYAGKSYTLTRPELIIGRVEDNDIVIEHRSVSRNHAKILFDGRTHKIIDLQSANGILVNGEEYAMTDLRKGDLIELGHVRFRFVPADEPFRPTAEEAQEMRAAGVAAPLSEVDDPDEPLEATGRPVTADLASPYDASQAQTVTDAPLSALESSVPNPVVEPADGDDRTPARSEPHTSVLAERSSHQASSDRHVASSADRLVGAESPGDRLAGPVSPSDRQVAT
ncbi:MAG: FHA domain-containing protein, partial [Pseudomonadota bacterium]